MSLLAFTLDVEATGCLTDTLSIYIIIDGSAGIGDGLDLAVAPAELVKLPPQAVHVAALAPPVEYVFLLQSPVIP